MNKLTKALSIGTIVLSLSGCGNQEPWRIVGKEYRAASEREDVALVGDIFVPFGKTALPEQYGLLIGRMSYLNARGLQLYHLETDQVPASAQEYKNAKVGEAYQPPSPHQ